MLILTRRVGESVKINEDITVTVLGIKGNQIRIGVDAPRHVSVHREEIYQRIKKKKLKKKRRHRIAESLYFYKSKLFRYLPWRGGRAVEGAPLLREYGQPPSRVRIPPSPPFRSIVKFM